MGKSPQQYQARAKIARALAHPSRLLILDALSEKDLCVGEITELVGADQSTVSKHLAILKEAGFLRVDKQGSMNYYSIRCQCLDQFFSCIEAVLRENLREQQELVQL